MSKSKKLISLFISMLITSCANLTPDQVDSIANIIKASGSPGVTSKSTTKAYINGTVYNSKTNAKIPEAIIKINDQNLKTDTEGYFNSTELPVGKIKITISKNGYTDLIEEKDLKADIQTINFNLNPTDTLSSPSASSTPTPTSPVYSSTPIPTPTAILKTSVSGYLREEKTNTPLPLTALKLGTSSAITDSNGYYNFPDVPSGNQILYEYLNGLDQSPVAKNIVLVPGANLLNLYYVVNSPVATPIPNPTSINTPVPTTVSTAIGTSYDPKINGINFFKPVIRTINELKPDNVELMFDAYDSNKYLSSLIFWTYGSIKFEYKVYSNVSQYPASQPKRGSLITSDVFTMTGWKDSKVLNFVDIKSYGSYFIIGYTATLPDGRVIIDEVNTLI